MGVNFVTTFILCDIFSSQLWDSLQKQCLLGRGKAGEGCLCFVLCGGGKLDYLAVTVSTAFSFPPSPTYRLTLILALHCVPDAAGQKAVEPLYTEVYIKNWWMQHVCGLSRKRAFLVEGLTHSLLTADPRKLSSLNCLLQLSWLTLSTLTQTFTAVIRLNVYFLKEMKKIQLY